MKWRVRSSGNGGYVAELGMRVESGIPAEYIPGCYMPGFIVREMARFDTEKEAKAFVKRKELKH